MATINDVYTHLKTLTKKWFYEKTEVDTKLSNKVDKETGKGLSTEDYTSTEKTKLTNIENEANKTTVDAALSDSSSNPVRNSAVTTAINGKAPTSHASSSNTYGLGTTTNYGHVKTINGLTQDSHTNGTALSAYQGKVLNDAIGGKVDKVVGKGLSTNDFTDTYKNKIDQLGEDLDSINLDWDSITQKPSSYPPTAHQHNASDVLESDNTDYQFLTVSAGTTQHHLNLDIDNALDTLDTNISNISTDWDDIGNKPTNFTPASHTHGNISNDGKISEVNISISSNDYPVICKNDTGAIIKGSALFSTKIVNSDALSNINLPNKSIQSDINAAIDTSIGYINTSLNDKADSLHTHPQYLERQQIKTINNNSLIGAGNIDLNIPTSTSELTNDGDSQGNIYLTTSDVIDDLTSNTSNAPLSAKQGKVLKSSVDSKANQSDLTALTSRVSSLETSEFQIVFKSSKNALPATGRANTLYYVSNSGSGENTYDEYTWVAADSKYELVGSKEIDLSGYVQKTNLITEIDTIIQSLNAIQE